jgi:hypothetical protein
MLVPFNEAGIGELVSKTFPSNRKPIKVGEFRGPMNINSYWSGGSRDEFKLIDLETKEIFSVPSSHPYFDMKENGERVGELEIKELPPNTALVCGGTFCGKPATVRVLLREENLVKMLPAPSKELGEGERKALEVICSIKGGYRVDEFKRLGLGEYSVDNPLCVNLIACGYLKANKVGAIQATIEGRNYRYANR